MLRLSLLQRMLAFGSLAVLAVGSIFTLAPAHALTNEALNRAILSTVLVGAWNAKGEVLDFCSGSIVHPAGYILTNWGCVGVPPFAKEDPSKQGLNPGDSYHPDAKVAIGVTRDVRQSPSPSYVAQAQFVAKGLDVAVLKIISPFDEREALPKNLPITALPLGDSDRVRNSEQLKLIAFPQKGGAPAAVDTRVDGSDDINADREPDSLILNPGLQVSAHVAYGAAAINDAGEHIGMLSWGDKSGVVDRSIMTNKTLPALDESLKSSGLAREKGTPVRPSVAPSPTAGPGPAPSPKPSGGSIGPITFGTDWDQAGKVVNPGTQFPTGTKTIVADFTHRGIDAGTKWGILWLKDGTAYYDVRDAYTWSADANRGDGTNGASMKHESGLPDGNYEAVIHLAGREAQRGSFRIGGGTAPPNPSQGVTIRGKVLDADTKRGIAGATVVFMRPGTTFAEFDRRDYPDALVAGYGEADQSGAFQIAPPLERGKSYGVVWAAKGYELRYNDNAFDITNQLSAVVDIDQPLMLKKR